MNLNDLNDLLESKRQEITDWMELKRSEVPIPIYGSVDVRDADGKLPSSMPTTFLQDSIMLHLRMRNILLLC